MTEIKFRVWDKKLKKYVDPTHVYLSGDGKLFSWGDNLLDTNRFTVEFYTGLKDKNGKEIYEGDIVSYIWGNGIRTVTEVGGDYAYGCSPWTDEGFNYYGHPETIEVIGNTYENKDLLE